MYCGSIKKGSFRPKLWSWTKQLPKIVFVVYPKLTPQITSTIYEQMPVFLNHKSKNARNVGDLNNHPIIKV